MFFKSLKSKCTDNFGEENLSNVIENNKYYFYFSHFANFELMSMK